MRLVIPLFDRRSSRQIVPVRDKGSVVTAQALDWPGVLLEAGYNDVAEVDDLTLAHHYLGVNADHEAISLEVREQHGFRRVTLAPGEGWFTPAGDGFSLRVRGARPHGYVRMSIDPMRFASLVNTGEHVDAPIRLRRAFGIGGTQLQHLVSALTAEAAAKTPSGLAFVDAVTAALALQLARLAGVEKQMHGPSRGGLAPATRRRVLELMDAQSDRRLSLDALAQEAGLSLAHFAHAFKESTGRAPHQHLMALRLAKARRLLEMPYVSLSDVAARAGFSDQAHLTRLFKREFGVTPGVFVRSRR